MDDLAYDAGGKQARVRARVCVCVSESLSLSLSLCVWVVVGVNHARKIFLFRGADVLEQTGRELAERIEEHIRAQEVGEVDALLEHGPGIGSPGQTTKGQQLGNHRP